MISGVGLEGSSALVLLAAGACGDGDAVVANWTGMMNPTRAAAADGANATYDFGIPVAGRVGFYRACWSHNFSTIGDFGVEIDASAVLAGPQPASLECTLGRNCTLSLEGIDLAQTNQIVAIENGTCGDQNVARLLEARLVLVVSGPQLNHWLRVNRSQW